MFRIHAVLATFALAIALTAGPRCGAQTQDRTKIQSPNVEWQGTFGGVHDEIGYDVQPTTDGGYVVTGYTGSFGAGELDAYLLKTDSKGKQEWYKHFGGKRDDLAYSVRQTADGGYITAGGTHSFSTGSNAYVVKTDREGNLVWQKTFGGEQHRARGYAIHQTTDGGYIVAGEILSPEPRLAKSGYLDALVVRIDGSGELIWQKTFGGEDMDIALAIQQSSDAGFVLAGVTWSFGNWTQAYIAKTDRDGNLLWENAFGDVVYEQGNSIRQTIDGGFVISGGYTNGYAINGTYLIKTDGQGNRVWEKIPVRGESQIMGHTILPADDGGYVVLSGPSRTHGGSDSYLLKTDANGNLVWKTSLDKKGSVSCYAACRTGDGGYVVTGETNVPGSDRKDIYLAKLHAERSPNPSNAKETANPPK